MKRIAMLMCLVALLLGQKSFADNCFSPCFNWCTDISYSVYGDYLYWKATRPEENYITVFDEVGEEHRLSIDPGYHSGYRVGFSLLYGCLDFDARYTSFHPSTIQNNVIDPTGVPLTYSLDYQAVDLAFGYTHHFQCHKGYLKPYVGAKLAWLKEKTDFFPTRISRVDTHAYGPMIGIEGSWELFRCWIPVSFVARGDLSVLSGTFEFSENFIGTPIIPTNAYSFIAVEDIFLGLGVDFRSLWCVEANLQIGYEAQVWNGVRSYNLQSLTFLSPGTLGLGGLVVRGRITY